MEKLVLKGIVRFLQALFSAAKWRRIWSKEWVLKVTSLVLATLLWYFVGGEDIVDKNVMMPIEIINLPRDLVISNQFKKEIEVTVSGPRSAIQEMMSKAVARQINLSSATPGTNVIENTNTSISVPRGITVLRIQPSSIILSLDKLIQKQFSVTPITTGEVDVGFELEKMAMSPDVITITGPETILSQEDELLTEVIDITGMRESKQIQVPLDLGAAFVDLIGETSVTADISIAPQMVEKRVSQVSVEAYVDGAMREVSPKKVDVILKIPVLLIRKGKDLHELFSVTAIDEGDANGFLKISVIPAKDNDLPIEVLSIVPSAVKLVRNFESGEDYTSTVETMVSESIGTETKEQDAEAEGVGIEVTETGEPKTVEEITAMPEEGTEVKILPVKKKIIIQTER